MCELAGPYNTVELVVGYCRLFQKINWFDLVVLYYYHQPFNASFWYLSSSSKRFLVLNEDMKNTLLSSRDLQQTLIITDTIVFLLKEMMSLIESWWLRYMSLLTAPGVGAATSPWRRVTVISWLLAGVRFCDSSSCQLVGPDP